VALLWKIYYADGSTFSNLDGAWGEAPADGVVCVNIADDDYGKFTLNGLNFYYSQDGAPDEIAHTNDINPQLRARCPWLKHGLGVPREKWKDALIRATEDPDFPRSQSPRRRRTDGGEG
jgi:hypothetical protein